MLIRAGASNRTMVAALGVNVRLLYTLVFGLGAALAGLAGAMAGPIYAVQPGMGEAILIQVFVVIVIGGIGSIRGAMVGAIVVGMVDTLGRAFLKPMLATVISPPAADKAGPALASMLIYLLMAAVLFFRPEGLFPAREPLLMADRAARHHAHRRRRPAGAGAADRGAHRPAVLPRPVPAHDDLRHRRGEPRPHPGLRRHGELRPRGLSRHRRLRGRHSRLPRNHERLRPVGLAVVALRAGGAGDRRDLAADQRRVLHHDHARVRPDALLPRHQPRDLRRRQRHAAGVPQPVRRADRSRAAGDLLLRRAGDSRRCCSSLGRRLVASRFGMVIRAAKSNEPRARAIGFSTVPVQAHGLRHGRRHVPGSPARCWPTRRSI